MRAALAGLLSLLPLSAAAVDAVAEYARRAALPANERCAGNSIELPVTLSQEALVDTAYDTATGRLRILYRMQFNDLTEGWNWHPDIAAAGGDYYTFKYLPIASTTEDRGSYRAEDKIGAPQEFRIRWRYDYFFVFDNPYDFYARDAGDDAGFVVDVPATEADARRLAGGDLRMGLRGRLAADCLSDSTTFWKSTFATPVDFTLKKRYLIGKLVEVFFLDAASGKLLARLPARP
ncbi:MAG: hypothetical protein IPP18_05055 [Rhodocyclaceae bacterium]|nr:hypothetical protein [Rhodocyclaceae bacterium]MBK6554299.1 hypothetical protein [Rhodocyclaceae bacterium]MBK6677747.1 hypothetical protein [Rhodocyclaceae bacterium]MBK9310418.1 hypothetical protein [Rhodocyclaceae bacterium]MBK9954510.1 hypothetical protein [Rhodocyclaceae bacterium]